VERVAVPGLTRPADRKLGHLLVPCADVANPDFRLPQYPVEVPILVGQFMHIGPVEDRELLIEAEAR
jgi:hypothetical protein